MRTLKRKHERVVHEAGVQFSWDEARGPQFARGRCRNVSEQGMLIETTVAIPLRSWVSIRCEDLPVPGRGCVRHCTRRGMRYEVGLEFNNPLDLSRIVSPHQTSTT